MDKENSKTFLLKFKVQVLTKKEQEQIKGGSDIIITDIIIVGQPDDPNHPDNWGGV